MKQENKQWQYEMQKKQERKQHKDFRQNKKNRKYIWNVDLD